MRKLRTAVYVALALVAGSVLAAGEPPLDAAAKAAIQSVITHQLDAIAHDDGSTAESFAAKGIRDKFPDGPAFMAMVHEHYAALIHPKSTAFGALEPSPHGPLQVMTIVAADGTVWTAIYSLEQVDGGWRITGCGLTREQGQQDI